MAKQKNKPCSNGCGSHVWEPGAMCKPCRSANPTPAMTLVLDAVHSMPHSSASTTRYPSRQCALPGCGITFTPWMKGQQCCSEPHGKKLWNRLNPKPFVWDDRARDKWHRRKARIANVSTGTPVLLADIASRDNNTCGLCHDLVLMDLRYPDPMSASLDHVQPISLGGIHDPSNVQLAHLRCNLRKGNRVDSAA